MGDVTAPDSLAPAVENIDIVYNLVALSPLFTPEGGDEMHDIVHREGTQNLVDAAETANVAQFVQMSALGADPQGPTSYIRAKGRAEEIVRKSMLTHTIIRRLLFWQWWGIYSIYETTRTAVSQYTSWWRQNTISTNLGRRFSADAICDDTGGRS
jgi:Predicted nucleoside-diphosphate-sugar epimerases